MLNTVWSESYWVFRILKRSSRLLNNLKQNTSRRLEPKWIFYLVSFFFESEFVRELRDLLLASWKCSISIFSSSKFASHILLSIFFQLNFALQRFAQAAVRFSVAPCSHGTKLNVVQIFLAVAERYFSPKNFAFECDVHVQDKKNSLRAKKFVE